MKRKTLSLSIPTPCHEKWSDMNPAERGRFCQSCQKTVLDFTQLTDREIAQHIQASNGQICGRFRDTQLNKPIVLPTTPGSTIWAKAAPVALGLLAATGLQAQTITSPPHGTIVLSAASETEKQNPVVVEDKQPSRVVTGTVVDEEYGEPLIGASILLYINSKATTIGTVTGYDGEFSINVPETTECIFLEIRYVGFETTRVPVSSNSNLGNIKVVVDNEVFLTVGILEVTHEQTVWNLFTNWLGRVFQKKPKKEICITETELPVVSIEQPEATSAHIVEGSFTIQTISPNPFSEELQLTLDAKEEQLLNIELVNTEGKVLLQEKRQIIPGQQTILLNTASAALPAASYFLRISGTDFQQTLPVVHIN